MTDDVSVICVRDIMCVTVCYGVLLCVTVCWCWRCADWHVYIQNKQISQRRQNNKENKGVLTMSAIWPQQMWYARCIDWVAVNDRTCMTEIVMAVMNKTNSNWQWWSDRTGVTVITGQLRLKGVIVITTGRHRLKNSPKNKNKTTMHQNWFNFDKHQLISKMARISRPKKMARWRNAHQKKWYVVLCEWVSDCEGGGACCKGTLVWWKT